MLAAAAVLAMALAAVRAQDQVVDCRYSIGYVAVNPSQIGCKPYSGLQSNQVVTWTLVLDKPAALSLSGYIMGGSRTYSYGIVQNNKIVSTAAGTIVAPGNVTVTLNTYGSSSYSTSSNGWTIALTTWTSPFTPADNVVRLTNSQPYTTTQAMPGGFLYFEVPEHSWGSRLDVYMTVYNYQGLQSPLMLMSRYAKPTLESFQYQNTTQSSGSVQYNEYHIDRPTDGRYFVGAFLYGTSASLSMLFQWSFDNDRGTLIASDQKVKSIVSSYTLYRYYVPRGAPDMVVQLSRDIPGGYPLVTIRQGDIPTQVTYDFSLTTTASQQYVSQTYSLPYNSRLENPGWFFMNVYSNGAPVTGYLLAVSFKNSTSTPMLLEKQRMM